MSLQRRNSLNLGQSLNLYQGLTLCCRKYKLCLYTIQLNISHTAPPIQYKSGLNSWKLSYGNESTAMRYYSIIIISSQGVNLSSELWTHWHWADHSWISWCVICYLKVTMYDAYFRALCKVLIYYSLSVVIVAVFKLILPCSTNAL